MPTSAPVSAAPAAVMVGSEALSEEEKQKKIKAVRKKLKQISEIKAKVRLSTIDYRRFCSFPA